MTDNAILSSSSNFHSNILNRIPHWDTKFCCKFQNYQIVIGVWWWWLFVHLWDLCKGKLFKIMRKCWCPIRTTKNKARKSCYRPVCKTQPTLYLKYHVTEESDDLSIHIDFCYFFKAPTLLMKQRIWIML